MFDISILRKFLPTQNGLPDHLVCSVKYRTDKRLINLVAAIHGQLSSKNVEARHYHLFYPLLGIKPFFCQRAPGPRPRHSTFFSLAHLHRFLE